MKNCTGIFCPMQYGKVDPATCPRVSYCPQATQPKTNADRIRAMTDEELAHLLHSAEEHLFTGNLWNYEKWTEWLKEEAENDNDDH